MFTHFSKTVSKNSRLLSAADDQESKTPIAQAIECVNTGNNENKLPWRKKK